ncbi:MAG: hypothetical protein COA52_02910 [Hyphomicrobiales bacterium]|nr:MAG: hypothetical protein COA52_02910 [Hyphomicrobiales bacterium]
MQIAKFPVIAFMAIIVAVSLVAQIAPERPSQVALSIFATGMDALINAYIAERWISVMKGGKIFPPLNQYLSRNGGLLAMLFFIQSAALLAVFPVVSGVVFYFKIADVFPLSLIILVVPVSLYVSATILKYSVLIPLLALGDRSQGFADIRKATRGHEAPIFGMSVLIYAPLLILILASGQSDGLSLSSFISDIAMTLMSLVCLFIWLSYLTKLAQKLGVLPSWQ